MRDTKKLLHIARDRRNTLKKEKEKRKMTKSQKTTINIFLLLLFFENIFGKTLSKLLHL